MAPRQRKELDTTTYVGKFAERLVMLREKKKMTIDELAEKSGIPKTTLFNWQGMKCAPTIDKFPQLAKALGVSVRYLMPEK